MSYMQDVQDELQRIADSGPSHCGSIDLAVCFCVVAKE